MSAAPKPRLTPEQYLAIERKAAFKSESYDGETFAMAGGSKGHSRVKENLVGERYVGLQCGGRRTCSRSLRVTAATAHPLPCNTGPGRTAVRTVSTAGTPVPTR